jgi:hypothetical protein
MSPSTIAASRSPSPVQDFLGFGEDFVEAPQRVAASIKTVDFGGLLDPPLLLHEDLADGCGGMLWPAGMRLAKYLLAMKKEEIRNAESMCVSTSVALYVRKCRPVTVNLQDLRDKREICSDVVFSFSVELKSALEAVWLGECCHCCYAAYATPPLLLRRFPSRHQVVHVSTACGIFWF